MIQDWIYLNQMKISVIGAGRVAYHLIKALHAEHQIVQVYSRTIEKSQKLASKFNVEAVCDISELSSDIDVCLIAVSDQSIAQVIEQLHSALADVLIAHTSGSTHLNVLSNVHDKSGVFYPLQTFSVEREVDWATTPIFVEAHHCGDEQLLVQLANTLSKTIYQYNSDQRLSLHLSAVFACNFSNYCFDMAKQIVDAQQVDFSLLYPLIEATAKKVLLADPKEMQTGPAMRRDKNIIAMHQNMLEQHSREDLQQVYALLSQQIMQRHQS